MTHPSSDDQAYARGRIDGEVASALTRHENHFERINGSLEKMADLMAEQGRQVTAQLTVQALAIQRLADLGDSREKTVKETAAALKVADDQRRDASATRDRPFTRTSLVIGAVVGVAGVVVALWVASRGG